MGFTQYSGPASAFPGKNTWKDFDTIFNLNKTEMFATGDNGEDIGRIYNAVKEAAKIGVEERVIFCIIMQESTGNVGVNGTIAPDGSHSGGLMQAAESPGFPGQHGLSQANISAMINAGTKHYKANLQSLDNKDTAETIYTALRLYNSGTANKNNLSDGVGATPSYVSDMANRLQGRVN